MQQFTNSDVELLKRETVYHGFFQIDKLTLKHRLFEGAWSPAIERELVIRRRAAACLLYDPSEQLVGFVEQFRVGALEEDSPWLVETVAGLVEPGESTEDLMRRELKEEAGVEVSQLIPVCDYLVSPGGSSEHMSLFCALVNLKDAGGIFGVAEEGEQTRLVTYPLADILTNLYTGPWRNATTIVALQWLALNKDTLLG